MKFKEIGPGMIIHTKSQEQAEMLVRYMEKLEYNFKLFHYNGVNEKETEVAETMIHECNGDLCIRVGFDKIVSFCPKSFYEEQGDEITEFDDLIEPEDEAPEEQPKHMTAEEIISWFKHFYETDDYSDAFEGMLGGYGISDLFEKYTPQEIVQKIEAYEAAKAIQPVLLYTEKEYCMAYGDELPVGAIWTTTLPTIWVRYKTAYGNGDITYSTPERMQWAGEDE